MSYKGNSMTYSWKTATWILPLVVAAALSACSSSEKFENSDVHYQPDFSTFVKGFWTMLTSDTTDLEPSKPIPIKPISRAQLADEQQDVAYRIGHSTVLMKLGDQWILTDPMFSKRASPVSWAGPERFSDLPVQIDDLPPIAMVLISHNHYDHLDHDSILALVPKVGKFLVPKKIGELIIDWGVPADKVQAMDWWDSTTVGPTKLVFTPTQHFSGRGLGDQNKTLWGSWVILAPSHHVYFSGDSGYFPGFKEVGDKYGPFDLAFIEDGQYSHNWPVIHMFPEQVVQTSVDLRAKAMMPIHNSTFRLSDHAWNDPLEQVYQLAKPKGIEMLAPEFGQRYVIGEPLPVETWWRL